MTTAPTTPAAPPGRLWILINPSDPYTFRAPTLEVAGAAVAMLSTSFGARPADGQGEETPVLFGWEAWFAARGIGRAWALAHREELAAALDSFLIGAPEEREEVERQLALLPEDQRAAWRDERHERRRSSVDDIGEEAYETARRLRLLQPGPEETPPAGNETPPAPEETIGAADETHGGPAR